MKSCNNCQFAFFVDYGYSNYTVEGTYFHCGTNRHPAGSFDRFYGDDVRLQYGQHCPHHIPGKPVEMDVDRDNLTEQKMTPAQLILWRQVKDWPEPPELTVEQRKALQALTYPKWREGFDGER